MSRKQNTRGSQSFSDLNSQEKKNSQNSKKRGGNRNTKRNTTPPISKAPPPYEEVVKKQNEPNQQNYRGPNQQNYPRMPMYYPPNQFYQNRQAPNMFPPNYPMPIYNYPQQPPYQANYFPTSSQQYGSNHPNTPPNQGNQPNSGFVKLQILVKELASFAGFFTEVKKLARVMNRNYDDVHKCIKSNRGIFSTIPGESAGEVFVELCPRINLCQNHLGPKGCNNKCFDIHICLKYLYNECKDPECPLGHNLRTNHNEKIIRSFYLAELPAPKLKELFLKVCSDVTIPRVCSEYNQNNCTKNEACSELHICHSYVSNLGKCSNGISCQYSHNIKDEKCINVMKSFGISLNESPRDLIKCLKDNCLDDHRQNEPKESNKGSETKRTKDKSKEDAKGTGASFGKKTDNEEGSKHSKTSQPSTAHIWGLNGNVEKPSVCVDFLNNKCTSKKCNYFHSKYPYHWQFGENSNWYNFHIYHVQILEKNYKNVDCNDFILPKLNPKYVKKEMNKLFTLLGTKAITVNFSSMNIDCEGSGNVYSIRHLTTDSSVVSNDKHSTTFSWYFKSDQGKWELYGNSESSSQEIEKYFLKDRNKKCKIKSATNNYSYEIDFLKMTQRNLATGKVRSLKRRPNPVSLVGEETEETKTKFGTPEHWSSEGDSNQIYQLVPVSSFSDEFKGIRQIFKLTLPMSEIVSILRIQNTHLWKIFQNKLQELEQKYKDDFLNIQKLFHGIDPAHLNDICEKNLDYRLHDDPTLKKRFGNGTYFYNSAGVAAQQCSSDFMGHKKILVAEVIIGKVTTGSSGMGRPPPLEGDASLLYDTTADDMLNPTVFSKYSSQEYYPSYIVEFK